MKKFLIFFLIFMGGLVLLAYIMFQQQSHENKERNLHINNPNKTATPKEEELIPDNLIDCDEKLFSSMDKCTDLNDNWVCGYDRTTYENGDIEEHGLDYRTPCHYCNFFGKSMEKDMIGTKAVGLGYTLGKCSE